MRVRALLIALVMAAGAALLTPTAAFADEPAPGVVERTWFPLRVGDVGSFVARFQSRLAWLGHDIDASERDASVVGPSTIAAMHAFDDKFAIRRTDAVTKEQWDAVARIAPRPGALPTSCVVASSTQPAICIDMRQRLLRLVRDGSVVQSMDARFGITGQETRPGRFRVMSKSRDHVSTIYDTPMPFALFFDGDRAVHYSAFFARDGYAGASHGCVNLRERAGARALFAAARIGTPVIVTPR